MDPRHHAPQPAAEAARADRDTWCQVRVPFDGTPLDGAVAEVQMHEEDDGTVFFTGEIRIPGRKVP